MTGNACRVGTVADIPAHYAVKQFDGDSADELLSLHPQVWIQQQHMLLMTKFMPCLAHDIMQPLSSICNFTGGLLNRISNDNRPAEELFATLDYIQQETFRASAIVKRIRSCTKRYSNELVYVAVNDSIRQSLEFAKGFFDSERITVSTTLADDLPLVETDSARFQQVILNLLINAAEAMRALPMRARYLEITTCEDSGFVDVAIKDFGPRISEEVFVSLTRPFFSTKPSALGLGLWACKTIVKQNGGELLLRQMANDGLEVVVRLPMALRCES